MVLENTIPIAGELLSVNPATGEVMRRFEMDSEDALQVKLQRATDTFSRWRREAIKERARLMLHLGEILEEEKQGLARIMTLEMGKLVRASLAEVEKCIRCCRYYAENAERFLADEPARSDATRSFVSYQPLGPVLAIMPWNFPFWQVFRFAVPALMAGNVALLKHASNVPQCATTLEDVFRRAGFPEGAFQALLIGSDRVARVIADPRVTAVTLTGSVGAGSKVAAVAGKELKKTVLELGGSDPFIVMPSADLNRALDTAVEARIINNGQSCIAAKRFIVEDRIYEDFKQGFVARMAALRVGDPLEERTQVGPLATAELVDTLEDQVSRTIDMGARVLVGGERLKGKGNFYAPTALTDLPKSSPAYCDELFGPVASLFHVHGIDEAISVANDSDFGLGSSCWTRDPAERDQFVREIAAGMVFVNGMVASDPRIPFGGVKNSGYGRELGLHGIREFVNVKTVAIFEAEVQAAPKAE